MKPIIEINHIWKEYQLGVNKKYKSLRDSFSNIPSRLFNDKKEKFWALEDISCSVNAGESLGIIGRNGAGKSTLLKILSRITPPTKGEVVLRGRVASLLEVGTGFHPELSGKENIFFNGSILGMKLHEIKSKFDEIVDFSGVEKFLDTPLKHYSSGMQMRLAFSVAAHLDAEILLIDEVLAVGDLEFQKKCIGKMDEVSKNDGKTILFVSHNLKAISELTTKSIFLSDKRVEFWGPTEKAINSYIFNKKENYQLNKLNPHPNIEQIWIEMNPYLSINCAFNFFEIPMFPHLGFVIYDLSGSPIFGSNPTMEKCDFFQQVGKGEIKIKIDQPKLRNGSYSLGIWFGDGKEDLYIERDCIRFEIENAVTLPQNHGPISPNCTYTFQK